MAQTIIISGKIVDVNTEEPIDNVTIQLKGLPVSTLSKEDGSFSIESSKWSNSLELTSVGYKNLTYHLQKNNTTGLLLKMQTSAQSLQTVVVYADKRDKEPGKRYMQKVIANKVFNTPDRFKNYSYKEYLRHEVDIKNISDLAGYGKGIKALVIRIYRDADPGNKSTLPIYFSESVSDKYHSTSPKMDKKNLLAKKTLGLETDKFLWHLEKFNFSFNIYDNWFTIFNQTYASPISNTAFNYYNFYFDDSSVVNGKKVYNIRFIPKAKYENAFSGSLWINDSTYSVKKVEMHLSKTANIDFINNITYSEEYKLSLDSATRNYEYMPYKFNSTVDFETGLELLGIPVKQDVKKVRLVSANTTVIGDIQINSPMADEFAKKMKSEPTADLIKPAEYWNENRFGDSLTQHEKGIYKMVDSLKKNRRYVLGSKIVSLSATGYWDFNNRLRLGPYSSFISTDSIEGWRFRTGLWTLAGFNKKLNLNGYLAYGTKDRKLKGGLGIKYIWNAAKWTKTALYASSDYDYLTDYENEMDEDNIINSFFRKNIPTTRIYLKQIQFTHEQYISKSLSAHGSLIYKEMTPVFDFVYHPLSKETQLPIDSVFAKTLPQAEMSVGIRFTHNDRSFVFNYDQIHFDTYHPIITANFTYGLKMGNAQFNYQKVSVGVEQELRLPPKFLFYYNIHVGKTFGTAPYLLLNVPAGNEYFVASRYLFNTMVPYEFAADQYISLYSRFYLGGIFFNKIPFIKRLGWRERFSFNAYKGSMSAANRNYNKDPTFRIPDKDPFMEAGVGIENIFHIFSVDYYQRISALNKNNAPNGGIFIGLNITF
ncbi:MAG: carboxypeptidase-like regulatory domain-containing protein [Bacteroidota bacterium]|nr:carboxypeptidase-like regulatory domain-containing protein [Bacteroidota bacterium]